MDEVSRDHRERRLGAMMSLGKAALSITSTRQPFSASSRAVGDPVHRAPTMIASYLGYLLG